MVRKYLSVLLLLLAALLLVPACGEEDSDNGDRPDFSTSSGSDTGTSGSDTSGSTSGTTSDDTSGSTSGTTSEDTSGSTSGNDTSGSTSGTGEDTSGSTSGNDTSGSTSGTGEDTSGSTSGDTSGSTSGACDPNTSFTGQVIDDVVPDPDSVNGGNPVTTPYAATYDSGIAAVIAQAPSAAGEVTIDLDITEATVTAVGYKPATATDYQSFWLADGQEAIQVFLGTNPTAAPTAIRVGDKVSFTATGVDIYRDMPQITNLDASTWSIDSSGNDVFIDDIGTGEDITLGHVQHVIRVTGVLEGDSTACGGTSKCTQLNYGGASTVTLRVSDSFTFNDGSGGPNRPIAAGDCVTFAGPAGVFDAIPQLDAGQFDWLWVNR